MYPKLIEYKIKNVIETNLKICNNYKNRYINIIFNLICGALLISVIFIILYSKYKNKNNIKMQKKKENEKRNYILYNLRKFQNINNKTITNIPFY